MTTPPRVRWGTMRPHADVDEAVRAYAQEHRISLSAAVERLCVAGLRALLPDESAADSRTALAADDEQAHA